MKSILGKIFLGLVGVTLVGAISVGTYFKYFDRSGYLSGKIKSAVTEEICRSGSIRSFALGSDLGKYAYLFTCGKRELMFLSCYARFAVYLGIYAQASTFSSEKISVAAQELQSSLPGFISSQDIEKLRQDFPKQVDIDALRAEIERMAPIFSISNPTDAQLEYYCGLPDETGSSGKPTFTPGYVMGTSTYNYSKPPTPPEKDKPEKADPSNLVAVISSIDGTENLSWSNNSADQVSVLVERATDKSGTDFKKIATLSGTASTYADELGDISLEGDNVLYRVQVVYKDGTLSGYSDVAKVSNCVLLGSGRGVNNIIYRRSDKVSWDLKTFMNRVNSTTRNAFGSIDPYKSYFSSFSFHADIKQFKQSDLPKLITHTDDGANNIIESGSSCGSGARAYVSMLSDSSMGQAWTSPNGPFVYMNTSPMATEGGSVSTNGMLPYFSKTLAHEMGHALANLNDEYKTGDWLKFLPTVVSDRLNCAFFPSSAFRGSDNHMYGALSASSTLGCGATPQVSFFGFGVYRPSPESIMNRQDILAKFNVISCGYLAAAINGEPADKAHAEKYWPICMNMDTTKVGIPAISKPPTITAPSKGFLSAIIGKMLILTGSGFTSVGNAVSIESVAPTSFNIFEPLIASANAIIATSTIQIDSIPSADGSSISFTVATSTPPGNYLLRAGALNSDWSSPVKLEILTP